MTMLFVCLSPTLTTCFRQRAPLLVMISGGVYCLDSSGVLNVLNIYFLQITPLPGYYTVDHIYPVGFCSTRLYLSISNTSQMCLYTCKVTDSGSAAKVIVTLFLSFM